MHHTEAQFNVGLMYAKGRGTKKDMSVARHWWQVAASKGCKNSLSAWIQTVKY